MEHDARTVANNLIEMSGKGPLAPLQIIKLACHGWMLGLYGRPLVKQRVKAWMYGPVIPDVYRALKTYRANPVTSRIRIPPEEFDERESDLIKQVHEQYGILTGVQLSRLTHAPETPWHEVWYGSGRNSTIPNRLIQNHYRELAA